MTLKNEHPAEQLVPARLLDASVDGMLAFDRECRYVAWNRAMERISGISRGEVLGRCAFDVFPFLRETGEDFYFFEALAGRSAVSEDRAYTVPATGRAGFFEGHYSPLYGSGGEVVGGVAIIRDITTRTRAEAALHESEDRYRDLVENSHELMCTHDLEGRILSVNRWAAEVLGYKPGALVGMNIRDGLPSERRAEFDDYLRAIKGDGFAKGVMQVQTAAGEIRFWEYHNTLRREGVEAPIVRGMAHDVTERRQALAREKEARKEAEAANRLKDEFLAIVSHELRTPLTSILGWARLLMEGGLDKGSQAQGLESIERNALAQAQLIDDLLDVSRIITGNLRLNVRPVALAPVIEAAVDSVRPAADSKDIRLQVRLDPRPNLISGDPQRLQQVVWNLLANAVKFTPAGGRVEVRVERVNLQMAVIVSDTGQGITPEFLPYVFDRFRQADGSTTRAHGGLGLGLAIVRHLVELHGGAVQVESAGAGRGTTFTIMLPLLASRPRTSVAAEVVRGNAAAPDQPARADIDLKGLRVLVVDDDEDALVLIKMALSRRGAEVTTAASAAAALNVLGVVKPDVLICDIGMPQTDGYELLRQVRALAPDKGGGTTAVALTAYAREEDKQKALAAGFRAHLAKPITPDELAATVASVKRGN